ncbi:RidA family protein [Glycomyces luteolus]|uniref:RidA family protein n=1 Tax=Glycomyces luteolus TaxID=2670330 RepID=A0A9X3T5M8_9ACTN|nr:RidA family protein [Glycomyces luteolus]MDA1362155.1 RidA family protein [Glycomyces luteolus]
MDPYARLAELGITLPEVNPPKGSYVPGKRVGPFVFVSGQLAMVDGQLAATGKVGGEITLEGAQDLSRRCALAAVAAVGSVVDLRQVTEIARLVGYVASVPGFFDQAAAVNGASDFLMEVFGVAGRHARTTVSVPQLPLDAPVEIELTVGVRD